MRLASKCMAPGGYKFCALTIGCLAGRAGCHKQPDHRHKRSERARHGCGAPGSAWKASQRGGGCRKPTVGGVAAGGVGTWISGRNARFEAGHTTRRASREPQHCSCVSAGSSQPHLLAAGCRELGCKGALAMSHRARGAGATPVRLPLLVACCSLFSAFPTTVSCAPSARQRRLLRIDSCSATQGCGHQRGGR